MRYPLVVDLDSYLYTSTLTSLIANTHPKLDLKLLPLLGLDQYRNLGPSPNTPFLSLDSRA